MARKITTIPATINKFTAAPIASNVKRKVAGYARVRYPATPHKSITIQNTSRNEKTGILLAYIPMKV